MRDLTDAGHSVVETPAAAPTPLDQIETRARGHRRRGQLRAAGALVVAVTLVAGAVAVAYNRGGDGSERRVTKPGVSRRPHLEPHHKPHHKALPDEGMSAHLGRGVHPGWKPVDFGDARVWVPPTWDVTPGTCGSPTAPGWIELGVDQGQFCRGPRAPQSFVGITALTRTPTGPRRTINGYAVYSPAGSNPPQQWSVPELHVKISGEGKDSNWVIASLGPSARRIALARAAEPVPAAWHRVSYRGVSVAVPSAWPVQLMEGVDNCVAAPLASRVVVASGAPGDCGPQGTFPPTPILKDGAWLDSPASPAGVAARTIATNAQGVAEVRVADAPATTPERTLHVAVAAGKKTHYLEIGLGPDGRVANAILHSIKAEADTSFAVSGCTKLPADSRRGSGSPATIVPDQPDRALLCVYRVSPTYARQLAATAPLHAVSTARKIAASPRFSPAACPDLRHAAGWIADVHYDYGTRRDPVVVHVDSCATGNASGAAATPAALRTAVDAILLRQDYPSP